MKQLLNTVGWIVLAIALAVILGFASNAQKQRICSQIQININQQTGNYFVDKEDIYSMMYHEVDSILGRPLNEIQTERLEYKINNHPAVFNSEIYKTVTGELIVDVQQRKPIVRIFTVSGDSYYLDETGRVMPASAKYTSRVFVANGFIKDAFIDVSGQNVKHIPDSVAAETYLDDIFVFAKYIEENPFWRAQIEQLYVNKDFEIELIPRVGNHRIVFGDAVGINQKFNKLKIFYKKGLSMTGWNEYSVINLTYANQVVCKKRN